MMRSLAPLILLSCAIACATSSPARDRGPGDGHCPEHLPPVMPAIYVSGPEDGCPEEWVGCLDLEAALALERYLRASQSWMREASARCSQ